MVGKGILGPFAFVGRIVEHGLLECLALLLRQRVPVLVKLRDFDLLLLRLTASCVSDA